MVGTKIGKFFIRISAILFAAFVAFSAGTTSVSTASAAESTAYTSVLEDLQKDSEFDVKNYPDKATDYSIKVIQIAESTAGELFIYTYQPCRKTKKLSATEINMSLSKEFEPAGDTPDIIDTDDGYYQGYAGGGFGGGGARPCSLSVSNTAETSERATQTNLYGLTLLSGSGTLCKYKVNDFKVSEDKIRYYNITSIYRKWNTSVDGTQKGDQTVNAKAYAVGQLWTVGTFGDKVLYDVVEVEVVTVTAQMVGFRRYSEGFKFQGTYSCDAHYLAFSCDHAIDRIISADISFYTRAYKAVKGSSTKYESKIAHSRTLYDFQKTGTDSTGWFNGGDYIWDRISGTEDFVSSLREQGSSITDEEVQTITQYDWILNFYETEYKCDAGGKDVLISCLMPFGFVWTIVNACTTTGTIVSDVTLMRLEFEYDGTIYNLGVVSDKQTGPKDPSGTELHPWFRKPGANGTSELIWWLAGIAIAGVVVGVATLFAKKE